MVSIDLVVIGSEVLNGFTLDTNTQFIATELFGLGLKLSRVYTLRDEPHEILEKIKERCSQSHLVITTGGLGPTTDDLTVDILSKLMGVCSVYDRYAKDQAKIIFREKEISQQNKNKIKWDIILKQTRIPKGAYALKNRVGIAPGIWLKEFALIALPGFPSEIRSIWPEAKQIIQNLNLKKTHTEIIPIWGIGESDVFSKLNLSSKIEVGVHALPFGCRLFLSSQDKKLLNNSAEELKSTFIGHVVDNPLLEFIQHLREKKYSLGTVESCTGGFIAKLITDEAGVSDIFDGSILCYSNRIKELLLGVSSNILAKYGAVSEQVVLELAQKGLKKLDSDILLAVTGIAGPNGGSKEKPVGTVYIAIADKKESKVWVCKLFLPLGRNRFRIAVSYALFLNLYQKYIFFDNTITWKENGLGKKFKTFKIS